ncbi:hypothetical protein [Ensifer sp. Root423]|uniref:hypothetical protein n=1 Tax=Ensifer sp. Root423 TaxID=1736534 RepID=UPI0019110B81|nr:hypothetical protein [Ensifer sp. Root423]
MTILIAASALSSGAAVAQVAPETVLSLGAPDAVQTRIGTLEFKDGAPTAETANKVYDALDFTRALDVYNNSFRGASALAIVKGFASLGVNPGDVAIFSELMDATSLFLTANAAFVRPRSGRNRHLLALINES